MRRLLQLAVLALLATAYAGLGMSSAFAERRVALIFGNSKYQDANLALLNPENDATDVAAALKQLGFEVTLALNATTRDMDVALKRFGQSAADATTVLFYYAGHALQFQGNNYLMPIDARLDDEIDLRRNLVSDEQIRAALELSPGVRIMILDACRNNPLADRFKRTVLGATRSVETTRGLARIDKAQGLVVAYAAAPGDVALDGGTNSRNSPFTTALIKRIQEPALEISTMFRRVTNDVWELTRGRQRPEYSSTLRNDFFLDPLADQRIWDRVRDLNDAATLREFISQFPYSVHVLDAQRRLELLDRARREREEQARLEQERVNNDRARRELCERETSELAAIGNDFAKLQVFSQSALCDQVRAIANERLRAIVAEREEVARRDEARRRDEEERKHAEICRNERATADLLGTDIAKLQEFSTQATCAEVRTLAAERAKSLVAQRDAEERKRQEAARICSNEQQALTAAWNNLPEVQRMAQQATCELVRTTAAERGKSLVVQRQQQETAALAAQARLCQSEQAAAAAVWDDLAKLRDLAAQAKCAESKPSLQARIDALVVAERQEQARAQEAIFKLAALEEERNRQLRDEQQRKLELQRRQQAELKCKQETTELATIETDVAKLRDFVKRSECNDVRSLGNEKIAQFERAEQACRDQDGKRTALLNQVKRSADRDRLGQFKQNMAALQAEVTCARLQPAITDAIVMIRVKLSQIELKRIGCFSGSVDGNLNDSTRDAAKLFLAKLGRLEASIDFSEELLSDLQHQNVRICKPAEPVATRHIDTSRRKIVAPAARPARPHATASPTKPATSRPVTVLGIGN